MSATRWFGSMVMSALLLSPVAVPAHSEGPAHGHSDEAQAVAKKPAEPAAHAMFRWTDGNGRVRYSQGLDSVPEQFRSSAVPLGGAAPASTGSRK